MEKYIKKYSEKNIKESLEPEELETDSDEEISRHNIKDPKLKIVFTNMLRFAKMNGVSSIRANQLVDEVLDIFFYMIDGGFSSRDKSILLKCIQIMKQRIGR